MRGRDQAENYRARLFSRARIPPRTPCSILGSYHEKKFYMKSKCTDRNDPEGNVVQEGWVSDPRNSLSSERVRNCCAKETWPCDPSKYVLFIYLFLFRLFGCVTNRFCISSDTMSILHIIIIYMSPVDL